ncbi:4Fe-4S dicluster domain-containing protein, partial [Niveibacterium sp. 24ML]|uniref:4Fe-4S dicluster domain-containing protein n=1 Tax=Niveibacterium sp. 24ML TaxID=2985512 RepID=UPI00226D923D
ELADYPAALRASWVGRELHETRNIKPMLGRFGTTLGSLFAGAELCLLAAGVRMPWTLSHAAPSRSKMRAAARFKPRPPLRPDGVLSFDRISSLMLANLNHEHDQPVHLVRSGGDATRFADPETRYCPAGVYELDQGAVRIAAQNCLHCKTCELHDPAGSLRWLPPEGGSGPQYASM